MGFKFTRTTTKTETVELHVEKCIVCGEADVETRDCGYSSFNVCGVKCKKCGRSMSFNGDYTKEELIAKWNHRNGEMDDHRRVNLLREQLRELGKEPIV